jgi:ElaB/YqjD/DUF883 family membrane-anchored ribosome-binding protein
MRGSVRDNARLEDLNGVRPVASNKVTVMSYTKHVSHLIDGAEELVHQLRHSENPDIQRLRDRVDAFVADAKQEKSARRARSMRITRIPGSLVEYVNDHPFLAVVTAASLAWTLGHLTSAAREKIPQARA